MAQSKKQERERYIAKLKAKGKYDEFLAKRKESGRKYRTRFRQDNHGRARERYRVMRRKYLEKLKTEDGGRGYKRFLEKHRKPARLRYHEKLKNIEDLNEYRKNLAIKRRAYFARLKTENNGVGYKRLREIENKQRRERLAKMKNEDGEGYQEHLKKNRKRAARRRKSLREDQSKKD